MLSFKKTILICFILIFVSVSPSQNICRNTTPKSTKKAKPELIARFDSPISRAYSWDILRKRLYGINLLGVKNIGIVICSNKKLLLSIPSAVNNPFEIIEDIKDRYSNGDNTPNFYFLRSEKCLPSKEVGMYSVEVWSINKNELRTYNEIYNFNQIQHKNLGFNPSVCSTSTIDSKESARKLIGLMSNDINSFGIIIGYRYKDQELNSVLKKSIDDVRVLMKKSKLSSNRYKISNELWHADDSDCAGDSIKKPAIIFITNSK